MPSPSTVVVAFGLLVVRSSAKGSLSLAAEVAPPPLWDCDTEWENGYWETGWTPEWKEWCCAHRDRGCPSTTTTTETSSTRTSTSRTSTTRTPSTASRTRTETETSTTLLTTTTLPNCNSPCEVKGFSFTCAQRINWEAKNDQAEAAAPCEAGRVFVISQCPELCYACSVQEAQCTDPPRDAPRLDNQYFLQRFEQSSGEHDSGKWARIPLPSSGSAVLGLTGLVLIIAGIVVRRTSARERTIFSGEEENILESE